MLLFCSSLHRYLFLTAGVVCRAALPYGSRFFSSFFYSLFLLYRKSNKNKRAVVVCFTRLFFSLSFGGYGAR